MKSKTKTILFLLSLLAFFVWANLAKSPTADSNPNAASVYFFDVGQGDASLITKGDFQLLIDGGPDDKILSELGKTMPLTDKRIEILVLTHPHADHLVGINQVLDRYEVGTIYSTGITHTSNAYLEFLERVKDKNIDYKIPEKGLSLSPIENLKVTFLWPGNIYEKESIENLNNTSEVVKVCNFENCIQFLGDLELEGQKEMLKNYALADLTAKIMKVSHHGSSNGTDQILLQNIQPDHAIISVGAENQFGHPHQATLDLINANNIKSYRTDRDGTIRFRIDDAGITKF